MAKTVFENTVMQMKELFVSRISFSKFAKTFPQAWLLGPAFVSVMKSNRNNVAGEKAF